MVWLAAPRSRSGSQGVRAGETHTNAVALTSETGLTMSQLGKACNKGTRQRGGIMMGVQRFSIFLLFVGSCTMCHYYWSYAAMDRRHC
jgi:hypothetical protein